MPLALVAAPRLPEVLEPAPGRAPEEHERWDGVAVTELAAPGLEARGVEILHARVADADLSGAQLRKLRLADCEVRTSNLANLMAIEGSMTRCAFGGCRLTGFGWPQATIEDVRFSDSMIDLAAFGFARLRRVVFADCVLRDADFREARLESVSFHRCDLSGAWFSGARFAQSEFRGCTLEGLRGVEGLRGAAMDWQDIVGLAGTMAGALGIGVLEDE